MSTGTAVDKEIVERLPQLNLKEKRTILSVVKTLVAQKQDWWDEIGEEQKEAIDKSLLEMKAGKLTAHDKVMAKYK
ncbi:MAG: hypothetical protein RL660_57 [Bacteroidota bacterium]|jgi:predicted transcriptional regulator